MRFLHFFCRFKIGDLLRACNAQKEKGIPVIRIYGKRWQIEVFFKTCKSYLNLIGECHSLSYDALTAHVAIVFARYMLLALEQRKDEDNRTLGEIFFYLTDELADITFGESFQIILRAMFEGIYAVFQVTESV